MIYGREEIEEEGASPDFLEWIQRMFFLLCLISVQPKKQDPELMDDQKMPKSG